MASSTAQMAVDSASGRIALFLPNLTGGGAERVMLHLARGLVEWGFPVDLVLASAVGSFMDRVPDGVRIVDLRAGGVLTSLPGLVRYLRQERPSAMLSALERANLIALWARRLSGAPTRIIITIHTILSVSWGRSKSRKQRMEPMLVRRFYSWADRIVAVSCGAADDIAQITKIPRDRIVVIYNPVVSTELLEASCQPVDHPWFEPGEPPVVLSVGRLSPVKNYRFLIRAFAKLRARRPARLLILGEGPEEQSLLALAQELGVADDVSLPGFVDNPFAYMSRAAVFVLSSVFEALPTVLIEALACGTPVVSSDCPTGPREILAGGRYGQLAPMEDDEAMACALQNALDGDGPHYGEESWQRYRIGAATAEYIKVMFPE